MSTSLLVRLIYNNILIFLIDIFLNNVFFKKNNFFCYTATNFTEGKAHVDVYLKGSPDRLFSMDQEIACDDFIKLYPILCPLKKGGLKFVFYIHCLHYNVNFTILLFNQHFCSMKNLTFDLQISFLEFLCISTSYKHYQS